MILSFLRFIIFHLCSHQYTYLIGMVLVRLSRWVRKITYKPNRSGKWLIVNFMGSIKMKVDIYSYMGGSIYWTGFHHLNELLFLRTYLTNNMVFADIGANQGEFSLYAASRLKEGTVLAFEPVASTRNLLIENNRLNNFSNIKIFDFGLSDIEAEIPIYTSLDHTAHAGRHEGLSSLYKSNDRSHIEQMVTVKNFDDIFYDKLAKLDFVKIDIEGAELFALRGMKNSLLKFKPLILIEINEETFNAAQYATKDLLEFLKEFNYEFYKIRRGKAYRINENEIELYGNYLLKPR